MKGIIPKMALLLGGALLSGAGVGCVSLPGRGGDCGSGCEGGGSAAAKGCAGGAGANCSNKYLYDPCYPERYNVLARREVNLAFSPQVQNGHVLDQTVWNHHFEPGSDRLTPAGLAHLQYLSRRRPAPDATVYLATSLDLQYDPACPERYAGARQELDTLRVASIQKYLTGLNAGRANAFQVLIHDPGDVSVAAPPIASSVTQMYGRYRGGLANIGGSGGGGSSGGGGGGGGTGGR